MGLIHVSRHVLGIPYTQIPDHLFPSVLNSLQYDSWLNWVQWSRCLAPCIANCYDTIHRSKKYWFKRSLWNVSELINCNKNKKPNSRPLLMTVWVVISFRLANNNKIKLLSYTISKFQKPKYWSGHFNHDCCSRGIGTHYQYNDLRHPATKQSLFIDIVSYCN